jgi:hypothetical protein
MHNAGFQNFIKFVPVNTNYIFKVTISMLMVHVNQKTLFLLQL